MELRLIAQMRFAKPTGGVTECFEAVANRMFFQGKAERFGSVLRGTRIELMTKALLITAGHKGGAGGAAIRTANVAAGKTNTRCGQRIYVRGWDLRIALAAQFTIAEVISHDDENIRLALGG